jgi:hypothetical protein
MSNLIGKIGDNAVIFLAAVLTACGVAMAFMPWQALYQKPVQDRAHAQAQAQQEQTAAPEQNEKGVFFVDMGISKKPRPHS